MGRRGAPTGLKKRALADAFFKEGHVAGRAELLQVAVDDRTLAIYCTAVDGFLDWCEDSQEAAFRGSRSTDSGLCLYFSWLCFSEWKLAHYAATTLSAVLHFRPQYHGKLPRASRALKAFQALSRRKERVPFSHRSVGALLAALALRGETMVMYTAYFQYHICGRGEQDWSTVRACDVSLPPDPLAPIGIVLGVADRGEAVKTGANQGVVVTDPELIGWLRARVESLRRRAGAGTDARVFNVKPQAYRKVFSAVCLELGLPRETPHILRHARATFLWVTRQVTTLNELKLAGRWDSDNSVKRYTKPHLVSAHESIAPLAVLELGELFWSMGARAYLARHGTSSLW